MRWAAVTGDKSGNGVKMKVKIQFQANPSKPVSGWESSVWSPFDVRELSPTDVCDISQLRILYVEKLALIWIESRRLPFENC